MGIGFDRMKQLIADVASDPNAKQEILDAVTLGNVAVNAIEVAERGAKEDFVAVKVVEFEPTRAAAVTVALVEVGKPPPKADAVAADALADAPTTLQVK